MFSYVKFIKYLIFKDTRDTLISTPLSTIKWWGVFYATNKADLTLSLKKMPQVPISVGLGVSWRDNVESYN